MSYPGYPPYQQNPGMPVPQQSGYPPYPSGGSPYPPSNSPYPSQGVFPPSLGYPANAPMYMPQPGYGGQTAPNCYPGLTGMVSQPPYPGSAPQPSYPGGVETHTGYPASYAGMPSQGSYPGAPQGVSSQGSYPGAPQSYPGAQQHSGYGGGQQHEGGGYVPHSGGYGSAHSNNTPAVLPRKTPTVLPANPFDPRADAEVLRAAMKGFGTDEKAIINVLARRTNAQRLEIAVHFKTMYGKDLIKDLKSELSGRLEDLILAMMTPIPQYYAKELHKAVSGMGTDEDCLIEVLCTLSNEEIRTICAAYQNVYYTSLESDLRGDTGGHFKRLMTSLCAAGRDESGIINQAQAAADAHQLLQAGANQWGTDESSFNMILCHRNHNQLNLVFDEYQRIAGHDIEQAVKGEFSGDIEQGLLAIVRAVRNLPAFFAKRLYKSMVGMGTDDSQLIRIVVTRSEIDMGEIKQNYIAMYGKTLADAIVDDVSGDYKKCLLALIGEY